MQRSIVRLASAVDFWCSISLALLRSFMKAFLKEKGEKHVSMSSITHVQWWLYRHWLPCSSGLCICASEWLLQDTHTPPLEKAQDLTSPLKGWNQGITQSWGLLRGLAEEGSTSKLMLLLAEFSSLKAAKWRFPSGPCHGALSLGSAQHRATCSFKASKEECLLARS